MATNFLYYAGTVTAPNNGLVTSSAITLITSEIAGLTNGSIAISATNGNSGVFTSSNTGQALYGTLFVTHAASIATAPSAGGTLTGWFMTSLDGGTTFESTGAFVSGLPRPPDFTIPHSTVAVNSSWVYASQSLVALPALPFKVVIQNNLGQTIGASLSARYPLISLAPVSVQY